MKVINCVRLESQGEQSNSLVARFTSKEEAEKAKTRAAGYGPNIVAEQITIYDTAVEFDPSLDEEAIKSGLGKLSERERKALRL